MHFPASASEGEEGGEEDVGSTFAFMTQKKWMCEEEGDYFFLRSTKKGGARVKTERDLSFLSTTSFVMYNSLSLPALFFFEGD